MWLLDAGIYKIGGSSAVNVAPNQNGGFGYSPGTAFLVLKYEGGGNHATYMAVKDDVADGDLQIFVTRSDGTNVANTKLATLSDIYADPSTKYKVKIGTDTLTNVGSYGIEIGYSSKAATQNSIAIGSNAATTGSTQDSTAVGAYTQAYGRGGVALGAGARIPTGKRGCVAIGEDGGYSITDNGTVDISTRTTASGYNSSNYRLLTGLYDGQSAHDAATVGQITPNTDSSAPTSATAGRLGEIRIDTTDDSAYMCVVSDSVTPTYTWKKITA